MTSLESEGHNITTMMLASKSGLVYRANHDLVKPSGKSAVMLNGRKLPAWSLKRLSRPKGSNLRIGLRGRFWSMIDPFESTQ